MRKILLFFVPVIIASACSSEAFPPGIVKPPIMKKIIWEMTVAESVYQSDTSKQTRLHLKDSITLAYHKILNDNKISVDDYKKSLAYYESKPVLMQTLIDSSYTYGTKIKDSFHYTPSAHIPVSTKSSLDSSKHLKKAFPPALQKHLLKPLPKENKPRTKPREVS
nr:DUF4296 domain-containing protein [Arachidicoccus sp. BS20]